MRRTALFVALVLLGAAFTGCTSPKHPSLSPSTSAAPSGTTVFSPSGPTSIPPVNTKAKLPTAITKAGTLKVAVVSDRPDFTYKPPAQGRATGLDADLADALGNALGVAVDLTPVTYAQLNGVVASHGVDLALSGLPDTAQTRGNGTFVDYLKGTLSILVHKGNPKGFKAVSDLCGQGISYQAATWPALYVPEIATYCANNGKPPVTYKPGSSNDEVVTAVELGTSDVALVDTVIAQSVVQKLGTYLEVALPPQGSVLYGIMVALDQPEIRDAVAGALARIIDNGTYGAVLKTWNASPFAVPKVTINGG